MDFVGVILAGGKGERFWPLSRESHPKQFLRIGSERTLIEETVERVKGIPHLAEVVIVSNHKFREKLEELFPKETKILEPVGKNTAPACALANEYVLRKYGDSLIGVFPSDHFIREKDFFVKDISKALKLAEDGFIVTIGIKPDRPETGYGYIEISQKISDGSYMVKRFHEKPDRETAIRYLQTGNFFWNAGMFIWKASVFDKALAENLPDFYQVLKSSPIENLNLIYEKAPSISVDYAIMEKVKNMAMVEASFLWEDLGSFPSLEKIYPLDEKANVGVGKVVFQECEGCIFWGEGPLVTGHGLKDLIIVSTSDVVLVIPKEYAQDVKKLREILKEKGFSSLL